MAKKRKSNESPADSVSDLLELAHEVNLPAEALNGDVEGECRMEGLKKAKEINGGLLIGQLEYLIERGYAVRRIRALILEYSKQK